MAFQNSAEVERFIGGVFSAAFADPEIGPKLRNTGLVLRFAFTEPDADLVVDMVGQTVGGGEGQPAPHATMRMTADTGSAFWQGKVNLPLAMARRSIVVEGNIASLLKLAPLSKRMFPVYIASLKEAGRNDLLV
ncbi:SCP2 sterol-binding domain-containing protein [Nocardia niigatensis]|uniref:SCP2 sterol-binding domain-containing protein n=1 Tax=Nocardia niigatensis TaxID=209249 RepID=UPI0002EBDD32|nr:SCP2 sterol-binding domain-containing protein [Nocardia niigatensis]